MGVSFLPSFNQRTCLLNDSSIYMIKTALSAQRMTGILLVLFQQFPNQSAGKQPLILEMPSQPVTALQQSVLGSVEPARKAGTTANPVLTKKYNPKSFLFNFVISRHLYLSYTRDLYGCSDIIVIISELTLVCLLADIYIYPTLETFMAALTL